MLLNSLIAPLLRWGAALLLRSGHVSLASQLFRAAEDLSPKSTPSYAHARSLWLDGQFERARSSLEKILAAEPLQHEAINLMGVLLFEEGKMAEARAFFARAIEVQPTFAPAQNNLGNVYSANLEIQAAENCYRAALRHQPDYVEALTNLGSILNLQGRNEEAERHSRMAVRLRPDFAGAHCNLGNILLSMDRSGEAVAAYREAIRLQPGLPEPLVNLALVLENPAYLVSTIDYYEKQLLRQPGNYLPHMRIAQAFQALNRWDEARVRLFQAIELKPDAYEALFMLGVNFAHIGDVSEGISYLQRGLDGAQNSSAQSGIIFNCLYLEECSGEYLSSQYRNWAESWATPRRLPLPPQERARADRRLRIGYVSRDFARHSVAYFFEPILKNHDREKFDVFCYSTLIRGDDYTERFKGLADTWRDISTLPDDEIVEMIIADEIDILVDLSGHTTGNRLNVFARKPAAVQVSYLGHPATTGIAAIDYRIGDAITDPPQATEHHYVEQIKQLPGCFLAYNPPPDAPDVVSLPMLANGHVTFGSFNNIAKVNPQVIALWAALLAKLPTSRLKLKAFAFASELARTRISEAFAQHGISSDRLELIDWRPDLKNHLQLYGEVDIALDTFPYNGTTTTCESLWMGVPVVSLEGKRHSARVGASLLTAVGLPELLADDAENFVRIALELAGDPVRLSELRTNLRDRVRDSVLLDHVGFTKGLEQAYGEMWTSYCARRAGEQAEGGDQPGLANKLTSLDLAGVAKICLPDSLDVITRYVVEEQRDWFEEEIRFVRELLEPGWVVLDVGANYGVYTLSMAAKVGAGGKVFSFEPGQATADVLGVSIKANQFQNVTVIGRAVSDVNGLGHFKQESNSELSRIVDADESTDGEDEIEMVTLDRCQGIYNWDRIDFIKIDAEGQEPNVVRGGSQLLTQLSPLVMAEYKHGNKPNTAMLEEFSKLGFTAYRLVPGLQLLVPIDDIANVDAYVLNLFFCKQDKAAQLADRGFLVLNDNDGIELKSGSNSAWQAFTSQLEYANGFRTYENISKDESLASYFEALNFYALARQTDVPKGERLAALRLALAKARLAVKANDSILLHMTLARILDDYGLRDGACTEFAIVLKALKQDDALGQEPFLAPSRRFEQIGYNGQLNKWANAAVAEWLASKIGHSSYYTMEESLRYLQQVRGSGYFEAEAERRIALILRRKRGAFL